VREAALGLRPAGTPPAAESAKLVLQDAYLVSERPYLLIESSHDVVMAGLGEPRVAAAAVESPGSTDACRNESKDHEDRWRYGRNDRRHR
jgi:hypothetical protein